jgi:hypothetical protein
MKHVYLYKDINLHHIIFKDQPLQKLKQFNIDNEKPVFKNITFIDILYNKNPINIQLPECHIVFFNVNKHSVKIQTDNNFVTSFIKPLEEYIVDNLYKHSQKLFRGKQFALNKLKTCLVSNVSDDNVINLTVNDSLKIYIGNKLTSISKFQSMNQDYKLQIIPILKLANLQFVDNRYTCNMILEQITIKPDQYLDEYSIYDNISESSTLDDEYYKNSDEIDSVNIPFF